MKTIRAIITAALPIALIAAACGTSNHIFVNDDAAVSDANTVGDNEYPNFWTGDTSSTTPLCVSGTTDCVTACSAGSTTTLSGTVYDPAGHNPLYGIVVYVPQTKPSAITTGASCYTCSDLYTGGIIADAVTDADGNFTLNDVPDGTNVPLVIQVGKWRMQYVVPTIKACQGNDAATAATSIAAPNVLRLPRNHSEGDIPNIAIATGGADSLECLLYRIGVDQSEYGPGPNANGRISIYVGDEGSNTNPPGPVASMSMWNGQADLMSFDMTLLTCEGHETTNMDQEALFGYAQGGGRVFASHFHYAWFNSGPFGVENLATWTPGANNMGTISANINTTFPRGIAMDQWLGNVGALTAGELPIVQARHNADVGIANTNSLPWIIADQNADPPLATEYFSFDTPFGVAPAQQCGRVVFSDLHVGAASGDYGGGWDTVPTGSIVPSGCANNALSPQEAALEFMLFDLSACIVPEDAGAGGLPPIIK